MPSSPVFKLCNSKDRYPPLVAPLCPEESISLMALRLRDGGLLSLVDVPNTRGKARDMSGLQPGRHPQAIPMQVSKDMTTNTAAAHHRTSYE